MPGVIGQWHSAASKWLSELLPDYAWRGLPRSIRQRRLKEATGLAADAASIAISMKRLELAVELLEQGRSILWSQQLQTRTPLDRLRQVAPGLAATMENTRTLLDASAWHDLGQTPASAGHRALWSRGARDGEDIAARQRRLADEWSRLVQQARAAVNDASFLAPTPFAELRAAATEGTVVIVNVSDLGSHAVLINSAARTGSRHGGAVQEVELPGLTPSAAAEQADALMGVLARAGQRCSAFSGTGTGPAHGFRRAGVAVGRNRRTSLGHPGMHNRTRRRHDAPRLVVPHGTTFPCCPYTPRVTTLAIGTNRVKAPKQWLAGSCHPIRPPWAHCSVPAGIPRPVMDDIASTPPNGNWLSVCQKPQGILRYQALSRKWKSSPGTSRRAAQRSKQWDRRRHRPPCVNGSPNPPGCTSLAMACTTPTIQRAARSFCTMER